MMIFFVSFVVMAILVLFLIVSVLVEENQNTVSSYECGFEPFVEARMFFSYRFFLVSILFLVFDVEISLVIPIPYLSFYEVESVGIFVFMVVLMVGLVYEYYNGVLVWL